MYRARTYMCVYMCVYTYTGLTSEMFPCVPYICVCAHIFCVLYIFVCKYTELTSEIFFEVFFFGVPVHSGRAFHPYLQSAREG